MGLTLVSHRKSSIVHLSRMISWVDHCRISLDNWLLPSNCHLILETTFPIFQLECVCQKSIRCLHSLPGFRTPNSIRHVEEFQTVSQELGRNQSSALKTEKKRSINFIGKRFNVIYLYTMYSFLLIIINHWKEARIVFVAFGIIWLIWSIITVSVWLTSRQYNFNGCSMSPLSRRREIKWRNGLRNFKIQIKARIWLPSLLFPSTQGTNHNEYQKNGNCY